jgi:hypothetical protein
VLPEAELEPTPPVEAAPVEPDPEPEPTPAEPKAPPAEAEWIEPVFDAEADIGPEAPEETQPVFDTEPAAEPEQTEEPEPTAPKFDLTEFDAATAESDGPTLDLEELIAAEQNADQTSASPERPATPPHRAKVVRAAPRLKEPLDGDTADEPGPGARGFDVAALILGVLTAACSPLGYLALVPAGLAAAFALVGLVQAKRSARPKGKALGGLALACVGGALSVLTALDMISLLPTLHDQRQAASQKAATAHLQQVSQAFAEYMLSRGGKIAPDLTTLIDKGLLSPERLKYPGLESGRDSDYFYLAPTKDDPIETIVLCEFIDCGRSDQRLFLLLNGVVSRASETEFQALAETSPQNQAFFEALREAEASIVVGDQAD